MAAKENASAKLGKMLIFFHVVLNYVRLSLYCQKRSAPEIEVIWLVLVTL